MGMERLVLLLEELGVVPASQREVVDIFIVAAGDGAQQNAFAIAEGLRDTSTLRVVQHHGGGSFKSQMKKADKSGARFALILGDQEVRSQTVVVKPLQGQGEQQTVAQSELIKIIKEYVNSGV